MKRFKLVYLFAFLFLFLNVLNANQAYFSPEEISSSMVKTEVIPVCWSQGENNKMFIVSVIVVKRYNGRKVVSINEYVKNIPAISLDLLRNFKKLNRCY